MLMFHLKFGLALFAICEIISFGMLQKFKRKGYECERSGALEQISAHVKLLVISMIPLFNLVWLYVMLFKEDLIEEVFVEKVCKQSNR